MPGGDKKGPGGLGPMRGKGSGWCKGSLVFRPLEFDRFCGGQQSITTLKGSFRTHIWSGREQNVSSSRKVAT